MDPTPGPMITMLDTVDPGVIGRLASTSPTAVAGYDDGLYNDIAQLEREYPAHHHLSICVFAWDNGDCLDIENGDATPAEAPGWVRRQHARGESRPCLYANESTMPAVKFHLDQAGIPRQSVRLWVAHYDGIAEVPAGYDAKQYSDHWHNRNVDVSVCLDDFFELAPPRPRPNPKPPKNRKRKRRRPIPVKPIHPKVKGASLAAILATGITAGLNAAGIHLTPAEVGAIVTAIGAAGGYVVPVRQSR